MSRLRNPEGFCCCLGFICEAVLGEQLKDKFYPENTKKLIPELTFELKDWIFPFKDTKLTNEAANINDDRKTTVEDKKRLLTELFEDSCYALKFVP